MTLNEYQIAAQTTAKYTKNEFGLHPRTYTILGFGGEVGEIQNEEKKVWRDDHGVLTPQRRVKMIDELGDGLWYLSATAKELGCTLQEIAEFNLTKLKERHATQQSSPTPSA